MNILEEAERIIYGDRKQTYGKPSANLERIAGQWSLYLQQKFGNTPKLTAEDVCWMMVDLKKCRQMNADKRDNLVDAVGYLALIERCADDVPEKQLAGPPNFANSAPAPVEPNKDPKVCDTFWPVEANSPWCQRCGYSRQKHSQHAVSHGMLHGGIRGTAYGGSNPPPVFPQPLNPEDNK